jgi:hypothetical protein
MKRFLLTLSFLATFAGGFLAAGWLLYLAHERRESRRMPVAEILHKEAAWQKDRELPSGNYFIGASKNLLLLTVRPGGGVRINSAAHRSFRFKFSPTSGFHVPIVSLAVFDGRGKFRAWSDVGLRSRFSLKVQWLGTTRGSATQGAFVKIGTAWVGPGMIHPPFFTYAGSRYRYGVKTGKWVMDGRIAK